LVNRTLEKGSQLATELSTKFSTPTGSAQLPRVTALPWDEDALDVHLNEIDLVINATSLGMKAGDQSPLPAALIQPHLMIYDTIYTSERTPLMCAAEGAGARSANGFSMLLHQGALAFEIWFEREAPLQEMREALLNK